MRRTVTLSLALVLAAGIGLGLLGLSALTAERLRIESALRQARIEALQPLLDSTNNLFVDTQSQFLDAVTSPANRPESSSNDDAPARVADLARAESLPLVAYSYRLVNGRLAMDGRAQKAGPSRIQRILESQVPGRFGKQMQSKLQEFVQQQEARVNKQQREVQRLAMGQQDDVPQQTDQQQVAQRAEEQGQTAQVDAQISAPVEQFRASNWAVELRSFADLVGEDDQARFVPLLMSDRLEVLYWHRDASAPPWGQRAQGHQAIQQQRKGKAKGKADPPGPSGFGFAIDMPRLRQELAALAARQPPSTDLVTAIIDDRGRVVGSNAGKAPLDLSTTRPFVSLELHGRLPRWQLVSVWTRPDALDELVSARRWSLGLLLGGCGVALVLGLLLLAHEVRREAALAAKQADFVSNVSHELKTPLTSIKMYAELLDRRFGDLPKASEYARVIGDESDRLTALVGRILDFSRIQRGRREYDFAPTDLGALLEAVVAEHDPRYQPEGYTLTLTLPEHPVTARADGEALSQVLTNLLSNARKYGGETRRIDIRLHAPDDGRVRVTVRDHGQGVPRRWRSRIFDEFVRIDNSLAATTQGSGIGLSLARAIARAHGGDLTVTDPADPGPGAAFHLDLPLDGPTP